MSIKPGREIGGDVGLDEFLKVLCKDRCECYWAIILLADDGVLFQEWDDCEGLQAGWEG